MRLTGSFEIGCPEIELGIRGVQPSAIESTFPGILDTGFDGFLFLPVEVAFQLSLQPGPTVLVVVADNATINAVLSECIVSINDREVRGNALVRPQVSNILVGMDFLKKAELRFVLDVMKGEYELVDQDTPSNLVC